VEEASMGSPSSLGEEPLPSTARYVPRSTASMGSPSSLGEELWITSWDLGFDGLQWGRRVHSAKRRSAHHVSAVLGGFNGVAEFTRRRGARNQQRNRQGCEASMGSPSSLGEESLPGLWALPRITCFNGVAEFTRRRARPWHRASCCRSTWSRRLRTI